MTDTRTWLGISDRGGVRVLTLNRPPVHALNLELLKMLGDALAGAEPAEVQALVITGSDKVFSAGLDKKMLEDLPEDRQSELRAGLDHLVDAAALCSVPMVAAINGHAIGVAAIVASLCDYRVAAEGDVTIGLPEVRLGLVLSPKIHRMLARVVGKRWADRLCVEGILLDAQQAFDIGFVDTLVPREEVGREALRWCEALSQLPAATLLETRANARSDLRELVESGRAP